jgi:hypothetical protein
LDNLVQLWYPLLGDSNDGTTCRSVCDVDLVAEVGVMTLAEVLVIVDAVELYDGCDTLF